MSNTFSPQGFVDFINGAPSRYHAVEAMKRELVSRGFSELEWPNPGIMYPLGKYFITTNMSSIIAITLPEHTPKGFLIAASHSDSPTFKVKDSPCLTDNGYTRLNVERYGGMICSTWMDRPLSLAGKLLYRDGNMIKTALVDVDRDCLIIPSLAIHMSPKANDGYQFKANVDMLPLYAAGDRSDDYYGLLAQSAGVDRESILGSDVFLYNRDKARLWGCQDEFVSGGRLDDLQCAYTTLQAFLDADKRQDYVQVFYVSDNEEIGSETKQGAGSTFLFDTLLAVAQAYVLSHSQYVGMLRNSFMLSCDNAHALHPNHPGMSDPTHRPKMNGGVVIKYGVRYATDGVSEGLFRMICDKAGVACQTYSNRSDLMGGSTLGNISNARVALNTVDLGIAQLAMHSAYETAGTQDMEALYLSTKACYNMSLIQTRDGDYRVEWE